VAVGAGMNLALCCDLIVASDRARFSEIFVKRGLMVDFAGTWLLPRRVGLARARELALTGRMLGAAEALEYGIINEMVPVGELRSRAAAIASDLAAGAPLALALTKAALERSFGMSFQEALELESHGQALCLSSEDAAEGVRAFLEKRSPRFEGR
jgi:enoyl-CoA hydratase/carnithine racemase